MLQVRVVGLYMYYLYLGNQPKMAVENVRGYVVRASPKSKHSGFTHPSLKSWIVLGNYSCLYSTCTYTWKIIGSIQSCYLVQNSVGCTHAWINLSFSLHYTQSNSVAAELLHFDNICFLDILFFGRLNTVLVAL